MTPSTAPSKVILDASLAGATVSAPIWMTNLETYLGFGIALGGLILLFLRIMLSWKELRGPKYGRREGDT
tara:strand:+ start:139 stop:348 length:210 start_codon:yes stop_codon:yes gene_type:complete